MTGEWKYDVEAAVSAFRRGVDEILGKAEPGWRRRAARARVKTVPAFMLSLEEVLSGALLAGAAPAGVRAFTHTRDDTAVGEVWQQGSESRLCSLSRTRIAVATVEAYDRAAEGAGESGDVRLLKIPAAGVEAFWVRKRDGRERVVPIAPVAPDLRSKPEFDPGEFMDIVRTHAKRYAEFDALDDDEQPGGAA